MIDQNKVLNYYSRKDVQEIIAAHAINKEVVGSIQGEHYRKRPDIIQYPTDVFELAKHGVTSFHASEESWCNPLLLTPGMNKKEMDENRIGWDLLLDIDCQEFEFSRLAGYLILETLKYHEIKSTNIKFSGNHGFHIGIPFEAFPDKIGNKETRTLFPEAPRLIALYIKEFIAKQLKQKMLEKYTLSFISNTSKKREEELLRNGEFDPYSVISIDTVLLSSRHLYRMPYSFNEKSGLISLPIKPEEILTFKKEDAAPDKIFCKLKFIERENINSLEGKRLLQEAYDIKKPITQEYEVTGKNIKLNEDYNAIPEQFFPPCIKKILNGLEDGKKRSLFILTNFLRCCHWSDQEIVETVNNWNKRNTEHLRETVLLGHLRYFKQTREKIPPPNCSSMRESYLDIGLCQPDNYCNKIKNPAQYAKKRLFSANKTKKEGEKPKILREKLTEEQKEMRRKFRESQKKTQPT